MFLKFRVLQGEHRKNRQYNENMSFKAGYKDYIESINQSTNQRKVNILPGQSFATFIPNSKLIQEGFLKDTLYKWK